MRFLVFFVAFFVQSVIFAQYLIGTGVYDITGAAAELGMLGYAKTSQVTAGIHQRLRARAFIIADPVTLKRVAIVIADLGMLTQSIQQGVLRTLHKQYGDKYRADNVLLSATHTHSGPGGYAHYALYNITTYGFNQQNYQVIVDGIVAAITRADKNLELGNIYLARGDVIGLAKNRSLTAYKNNPLVEQKKYQFPFDITMILLKFISSQGSELGELNWFPLHGVSMSSRNKLISGDNKGYASYLFEKNKNVDYSQDKTFVAAFAQENEGDVSPNIHQDDDDGSIADKVRTKEAGAGQFKAAFVLYNRANDLLQGSIDSKLIYIRMANYDLYLDKNQSQMCLPTLGYAFAAGTVDGRGVDFFKEGELESNVFIDAITGIITQPDQALIDCQQPKPILLAVGNVKPVAWVPEVVPIQLIKLGQIIIAALPVEITTMSGRRIRENLNKYFPGKIIITASLSNAYTGYLTTPEEYGIQNYEGGHNVFGSNTLLAYEKILGTLAKAIIKNKPVVSKEQPPDLSSKQISFQTPVLFDDVPLGHHFGEIKKQDSLNYKPGDTVKVEFWSGHPKNNLLTQQSFFTIQHQEGSQWVNVLYDWDWDTEFSWHREGIAYSYILVKWKIDPNIQLGLYRIINKGWYKDAFTQDKYPYQGISNTFSISNRSDKYVISDNDKGSKKAV